MATVHLQIRGKVQGVFYRAAAKELADQLGLSGWIKNTTDGGVEATVSGPEEAVQQFVQWCKDGPRRAEVAGVQVTEKPDSGLIGFEIIR